MPSVAETDTTTPRVRIAALAILTAGLGLLALFSPLSGAEHPAARVGWVLAFAAAIEVLHALRRSSAAARRRATTGALISMAIALFLINATYVAAQALRLLVAGLFAVDAARYLVTVYRDPTRKQ